MEYGYLVLKPEAIRYNEIHWKCNNLMDRQDEKIEQLESQVANFEDQIERGREYVERLEQLLRQMESQVNRQAEKIQRLEEGGR